MDGLVAVDLEERDGLSASEKLLFTARKRFDQCDKAEHDNRKDALDDIKFLNGEQWDPAIKAKRKNRPCLTLDRLNQFRRQVINDIRQNRPTIKVQGVDDKADPEVAKILSGLIKHIEYNSNADVATDTAADCAVSGGFGYFRITTDYCTDDGDEQDIFFRRIANPFTVYMDPDSQEPDNADARFAFVTEQLSRAAFKAQYPKAEALSVNLEGIGDNFQDWISEDSIRIAEYWVVEETEVPGPGKRKAKKRTVKCYKISGADVLEENVWPGRWIPIIPVLGEEVNIEGKRILRSLIRGAKDAQKLYNFWKSTEAELLQKSPKTPYVGAKGQFKGQEAKWASANVEDWPYLEYEPVDIRGTMVGPPQRVAFPGPPTGLIQAAAASSEDIMASLGMYHNTLGQQGNETSGRAIMARQREGDNATFHFTDNLVRAIRHAGRILVDLIPKIYDSERMVRILGEDGSEKIVKLNEIVVQDGIETVLNDVTVGRFDVVVSAGPSYATKRQEAAESMMAFVQAVPNAAAAISDLVAQNMDWPGAEKIAERLKKTLPPGLADETDEQGNPIQGQQPPPPEMVQAIQESQQIIAQLEEQLAMASQAVEDKAADREMELEKERIKADAEIKKAAITAQTDVVEQLLQQNAQLAQAQDLLAEELENLRALLAQQGSRGIEPVSMPYMESPEGLPPESFGEFQ